MVEKNNEGKSLYYDEKPFDVMDLSNKSELLSFIERDEPELKDFIKKVPPSGIVLDIGAGAGRVSIYLNSIGSNVLSFDNSLVSLKILRSHSSIPCILADNLNLPVRSDSAQAVISTGVIHHTKDPYQSLRENCRVLSGKGQLYLRTYARHSYYDYLYRYLGGILRQCNRGKWGQFLVNRVMFWAFVLVRLIMKPNGIRRLDKLCAIYSNAFLKTGVSFLERDDLENLLEEEGLQVWHYDKRGYMHLFNAEKVDAKPAAGTKLMDILACPVCKGKLEMNVEEENKEEVVTGSLYCNRCDESYTIMEAIPHLLPPDSHR